MDNSKFQLFKSPLLVGVIFVFLVLFIGLLFFSFNQEDDEVEITGAILETNISHSVLNPTPILEIKNGEKVLYAINLFFSNVYPDVSNSSILEDSISYSEDGASFKLQTSKNDLFYINLNNDLLTIKNTREEEVLSCNVFGLNYQLSPHLIDDYFPYIDNLSDNNSFKAELQENKKDIKITIPSCVPKEKEKEAIEKTKDYIKNLGSDTSFFKYSVSTFCF